MFAVKFITYAMNPFEKIVAIYASEDLARKAAIALNESQKTVYSASGFYGAETINHADAHSFVTMQPLAKCNHIICAKDCGSR